MNLLNITDKEIRKLCSESILQRGYQYYYRSEVEELLWDNENECISAVVRGSSKYEVDLYVSQDGTINDYYCSCPAYGKYEGICKHLVATLLEVKDSKEELFHAITRNKASVTMPYTPKEEQNSNMLYHNGRNNQTDNRLDVDYIEKKKANDMIQSFQQIYVKKQETYNERETLEVEYILKLEPKMYSFRFPSIEIELKIGPKRLYVVKDMKEFLRTVEQEGTLRFAKLFTYDPADYVFSEEDEFILQWLWRIYHLRDEHRKRNFYTYGSQGKDEKRYLEIPAPLVKEFLEMIETRNVVVDVHGFQYKGFDFVNGTLPLQFKIGPSEDYSGQFHFKWENEEDIAFFGPEYGVLFYRGCFYELEPGQGESIDLLISHMTKYHPAEMTITKDQLENFASLVLPQLKNVGEVDVSEDVREKIHLAPLKGKLYVDYQEERLTAELIFQYGEDQYSPFDPPQPYSGKVTVRDVEKEYLFLSHVERVPFKYNGKELYLEDFDAILEFVMEDLPRLSQMLEVYATSQVKGLVYEPLEKPSVKVEADERLNLLDVEFQLDGINEEEIDHILQALLDNKKYYRLTSGSFINLDNEEFQDMKGMLAELDIDKKDVQHKTKLPMLKAFQFAESDAFAVKKGKAFRNLIERVLHPEELEIEIPEELDDTLRDYQKTGYQWLKSLSHYGFGGILADDMGLGKTLQMITYLLAQKKEGDLGTTLIICPSSLVYNWQKEIERFAPELSTVVISGTASERKVAFEQAESKTIWITSYPLVRRDLEAYGEKIFSTLILDEAQYVKNDWTKTAKAVRAIRAKHAFALSGTPIENSLNELYSIIELVLPGLFKNKNNFKALEQEKVAKRVRPFVLRRLKKDVLTELPEKMESVQYTELTDQQKKLYLAQLRLIQNDAKEAITAKTFQENRIKILAGLTRLRQICCHPSLFMKEYEGGSGKMERLFEYLEEAIASGRRVVLFSQFTQMLGLIQERLKQYGWSYHYLDGSTPPKKRLELADRFNNGEKELFLISLKAGGTGLNLTGGDTVILFDSWWNPAVEEQAADRVYRFGQKKVVQVTKLITTGTIEEKIHKLQGQKRELLDRVIQPGETMISSLSKEDIEELLEI